MPQTARTSVTEPAVVRAVDPEVLHRAVDSRDPRFDGRVYLGVTSTGIYCRPSCPARRPRRENRRFYGSAAAAVAAGFRACRMCRPDALPGSRDWDHRGDLAARALRLIESGHVDECGVSGLASSLHVSERQLHRVLNDEVGAGAHRLARSRRAQTARLLIDQTARGDLTLTEIAFASGFSSLRQFNEVMREEFGVAPSALRRVTAQTDPRAPSDGSLVLRLKLREPYRSSSLLTWFAAHAVPGLEAVAPGAPIAADEGGLAFGRVLNTPHGPGSVWARPADGCLVLRMSLPNLSDLSSVVSSVRRMWDLDADPSVVDAALAEDPALTPLIRARPGLRVPGADDGFEVAVRAILGQQVSVAAARTFTARLVERHGASLPPDATPLHRAFPSPEVLAGAELDGLGLVGSRVRAVRALAEATVHGLRLVPGADRHAARAALLALPGVGPWTADYVALRALGDPDAWLGTDLVLRRSVRQRGADPHRWRPWRAYAAMHLWTEDALEAS